MTTLQSKLFYGYCGLLSFFSMLLVHEYLYFRRQAAQVRELHQEYQYYVDSYKQAMEMVSGLYQDATEEETDTPFPEGAQVVSSQQQLEPSDEFLVVNRDQAYLKQEAVLFGKQHAIDDHVRKLYEGKVEPVLHPRKQQQGIAHVVRREPRPVKRVARYGEFVAQWPIDQGSFWLSSKFGPRKRKNGALGFHAGIDMAAPKGTLVKSSAAGKVLEASTSEHGYGKCVVIRHENNIKTRYAHLDSISIKVGDTVAQGQVIGRVGSTGSVRARNGNKKNATHLHYEVAIQGKRIDPLAVLA